MKNNFNNIFQTLITSLLLLSSCTEYNSYEIEELTQLTKDLQSELLNEYRSEFGKTISALEYRFEDMPKTKDNLEFKNRCDSIVKNIELNVTILDTLQKIGDSETEFDRTSGILKDYGIDIILPESILNQYNKNTEGNLFSKYNNVPIFRQAIAQQKIKLYQQASEILVSIWEIVGEGNPTQTEVVLLEKKNSDSLTFAVYDRLVRTVTAKTGDKVYVEEGGKLQIPTSEWKTFKESIEIKIEYWDTKFIYSVNPETYAIRNIAD